MLKSEYFYQAARIIVACAISYGASKLIGLQEGYWALITCVVVTQPALEGTLLAGRDRVIGTLIGAALGFAVLESSVLLTLSEFFLFWIALIPLAILTAIRPNLRLSCITLVIVVLVPASGTAFARPLERVSEILLGTLASIIVAVLI